MDTFESRLSASALHWCRIYGYPTNDAVRFGMEIRGADEAQSEIEDRTLDLEPESVRLFLIDWLESPNLTTADLDAVVCGFLAGQRDADERDAADCAALDAEATY